MGGTAHYVAEERSVHDSPRVTSPGTVLFFQETFH